MWRLWYCYTFTYVHEVEVLAYLSVDLVINQWLSLPDATTK